MGKEDLYPFTINEITKVKLMFADDVKSHSIQNQIKPEAKNSKHLIPPDNHDKTQIQA